ncbi:hypothetical protein GCM10010451_61200 [Streptomyces virens]|uniref:Transposase n=1 Tax=Streptomyces virens TaxID=285572 RepID=A0ABP6Q490_9ACTN
MRDTWAEGLGRLWAVGGRPKVANNDRQQPFKLRPAPCRCRLREVTQRRRHFLRNKKQEWEEYRSEVTAFELRKNLPVL